MRNRERIATGSRNKAIDKAARDIYSKSRPDLHLIPNPVGTTMPSITSAHGLRRVTASQSAWQAFRKIARLVLFTSLMLLLTAGALLPVRAATLPINFSESQIASGMTNPTAMAFAPDGRLFVCQQGGQLRVIKNGALLTTPFVTLTVDSAGERGLLGVAFDPDFVTNQFEVWIKGNAEQPAFASRINRQ